MSDSTAFVIIGAISILLGIINCTGNISTLHYYHRKRVSEEDRLPFGRMVGLGTIIIGISLIVAGVMSFIATRLETDVYSIIGTAILIAGLVVGCGITFFAMIKYNKGIF